MSEKAKKIAAFILLFIMIGGVVASIILV